MNIAYTQYHPYKLHQYYNFEKSRITSTKLSDHKDQKFLTFKDQVAKVEE